MLEGWNRLMSNHGARILLARPKEGSRAPPFLVDEPASMLPNFFYINNKVCLNPPNSNCVFIIMARKVLDSVSFVPITSSLRPSQPRVEHETLSFSSSIR